MIDWICSSLDGVWALFAGSPLWTLFISGFLSATLLPGGSEATLLAALKLHHHSVYKIITVATLGNTLGAIVNYGLGIWIPNRFQKEKHSQKALVWLQKYGYWALLFSWLPVVGDVLCLAAGWLRMKFLPSVVMILFGKAIRYMVLAAVFLGFFKG